MGFEMRNEKNWHEFLVVLATSYGMEISIAGFYPSDDKYGLLEEQEHSALGTHPHHTPVPSVDLT